MNTPILSSYTLVTAFFDIGRNSWNALYRRNLDWYFENAKRLLTLQDKIIIYMDDRYIDKIKEICKDSMDKTIIVPMKINQLPYYKY